MIVREYHICIPFTPGQNLTIKEFSTKRYVTKIKDKWEREICYQGIDLGFNIILFKTTYDTSSLLIFNWDQVIYKDGKGRAYTLDLVAIES